MIHFIPLPKLPKAKETAEAFMCFASMVFPGMWCWPGNHSLWHSFGGHSVPSLVPLSTSHVDITPRPMDRRSGLIRNWRPVCTACRPRALAPEVNSLFGLSTHTIPSHAPHLVCLPFSVCTATSVPSSLLLKRKSVCPQQWHWFAAAIAPGTGPAALYSTTRNVIRRRLLPKPVSVCIMESKPCVCDRT